MVESRDAQNVPTTCQQDGLSADALYKQGMTYYRRHQWRQAREAFQGIKRVDPSCREVDSLLDELDIFIRLESCTSSHPLQETSRPGGPSASPLLQVEETIKAGRGRRHWVGPAVAGAVVLMFVLWGVANPRLANRVQALHDRGAALYASGQWSQAINTYEELVLLEPRDAEVRHDLASAYYSRGLQHSADAQSLEERQSYRQAAQQWEMAQADFRAACDVVPNGEEIHPPDDPAERIAVAQERRSCANQLYQALQLKDEGRWPEAIELLQSLQNEQPDYRPTDVRNNLSQACLDYGRAAIAGAETPAQIQAGIDLIRQAHDGQPADAATRLALERAEVYLQAATAYEDGQWTSAISTLETLLENSPGYAGGGAQSLLCRAYMQRASESFRAGQVQPALADYRLVSAGTCDEQPQAQERVVQLAQLLTPTPLPLRTATPTLVVSPVLSLTPTLTSEMASMSAAPADQ